MKHAAHHPRLMPCCVRCRGFALPTLMVMLALTSLATLLALRNLWVNDQLLNAEADQLRTQHKVEAALPVALADITGIATNNSDATLNLRHTSGNATQTHAFFPTSMTEYALLRQRLSSYAPPCSAGICAPNSLDVKATKACYWKARITTAMPIHASDTPYGSGTAWYWVEVFPQPNTPLFVYRITTLANGVMPGSTTVLQGIWVRNTAISSSGQWRSWHVLHD